VFLLLRNLPYGQCIVKVRTVTQAGYATGRNLFASNRAAAQSLITVSFRVTVVYLRGVPITIELPDLASQTKFNLARWTEILADPELAKLPYRIETDQHGHLLMTPPPAPLHGNRQIRIGALLQRLLPAGDVFSECPVSTAAGVKAVDVAWLAPGRTQNFARLVLFERVPEICVEILSPSNSASEIDEKRALFRCRRNRGLDLRSGRFYFLLLSFSSAITYFFHLPGFSPTHPVSRRKS
jgi:hypothetical protein